MEGGPEGMAEQDRIALERPGRDQRFDMDGHGPARAGACAGKEPGAKGGDLVGRECLRHAVQCKFTAYILSSAMGPACGPNARPASTPVSMPKTGYAAPPWSRGSPLPFPQGTAPPGSGRC